MMKSELRKLYLEKRRAISPSEHSILSEKIAGVFFDEVDLSRIASVHCFISMVSTGEVETRPIFDRVWREFRDIKTYAPRVNDATGEIDSIAYSAETSLLEHRWGIPEPADGEPADPKAIDLVIVPLICVDLRGYRVGYGKGFYDRFLNQCRPDCLKVGLSFFPPIEKIDDVHNGDVPLNCCVTPSELYYFDKMEPR